MDRTFVNPGAKCALVGFPILLLALLAAQFEISTAVDYIAGAFISIIVGFVFIMCVYFVCYHPSEVAVSFNKPEDSINVVYHLFFGRNYKRSEKISNVEKVEFKPVKSQYGVGGYEVKICFKDKNIQSISMQYDNKPDVKDKANELS